ncbi:MAG: hypothetical protein Q8N55_00860 [bacterium]|nr:hypothetical protein [bacterium]
MKKIITIALVSLSVLAVSGTALAFGGWGMGGFANNITPQEQAEHFTGMLSAKAGVLGITADQMKAYWVQGKPIQEIATELGITKEQMQTKMQGSRKQALQEHLQVLVSQGVITQAQADARLVALKSKTAKGFGFFKEGGRGGCPFHESN